MNIKYMNRNKLIVLIGLGFIAIVLFFLVFNNVNGYKNSDGINLQIKTEFTEYLLNQDVWVEAELRNETSEIKYLTKKFTLGAINFTVIDPDNVVLHKIGSEIIVNATIDTLLPGQSIKVYVSMWHYLQDGPVKLGKYKISGEFSDIKTKEIDFETIEPTGRDKEIMARYSSLQSKVNLDKDYFIKHTKILETILVDYPDTKYSPQIFDELIAEINHTDKENTDLNRLTSFINNYLDYNSKYIETISIISQYSKSLSKFCDFNEKQIETNLVELSGKHKGALLDTLITQFISKQFHYK